MYYFIKIFRIINFQCNLIPMMLGICVNDTWLTRPNLTSCIVYTIFFLISLTQLMSLHRSDSDLLPTAWRDSWSKAFPGSQPPLSTRLQHYCCLMYNTCHGLVGFRAKHFYKHCQYRLVDHKYQLPLYLGDLASRNFIATFFYL